MSKTPSEEPAPEAEAEAGAPAPVADDLLNASYNYLLDRANSFLYM